MAEWPTIEYVNQRNYVVNGKAERWPSVKLLLLQNPRVAEAYTVTRRGKRVLIIGQYVGLGVGVVGLGLLVGGAAGDSFDLMVTSLLVGLGALLIHGVTAIVGLLIPIRVPHTRRDWVDMYNNDRQASSGNLRRKQPASLQLAVGPLSARAILRW